MRFRNSDVIVQLGLNVETGEFATAAGVAGGVAAEFGATALEIRRADPEAGYGLPRPQLVGRARGAGRSCAGRGT
jgi:hypothetical protein